MATADRGRSRSAGTSRARQVAPEESHATSSACATSATVSHSCGCSTLATWGANAGEETTVSGRAVGDHLTIGQHDDPVGDGGDELHVVRGQHHRPSLFGQSLSTSASWRFAQ